MQIINPIYDTAFKYLMDNNQVAKLIISAIIGEEVEELLLDTTELKVDIAKGEAEAEPVQTFYTVLRIDFAARIRTSEGKHKEVLIEIQKAKMPSDIMRFRRYLGERYMNENVSIEINGTRKALPILPIYFLGHPLEHCEASVIKVNRQYIDAVTNEPIEPEEEFIESLTHNSYVIQIAKLRHRRRNDLEALLSIFDQDNISNDKHLLNIKEEDIPEKYRPILRRLLQAVSEKKVRDGMKVEDEILDEFKHMERQIELALQEKEEAIAREVEERRLKEEAKAKEVEERRLKEEAKAKEVEERRLKEEAKAKEVEERRLKEEAKAKEVEERTAKEKAQEALRKSARAMKQTGMSISLISQITGLTEDEIEAL